MKKQKNKQFYMAFISYNNLWQSEFENIVSKVEKIQEPNINQLELKVNVSQKKMKK